MFPRSYRAVLVLTAAVLVGAGRVHGQFPIAATPTRASAAEPLALPSLESAAAPLPPADEGRVVVASSHGQAPPPAPAPLLLHFPKLPDDGLVPPPPPPAAPAAPATPVVTASLAPPKPAPALVQPAVYHPDLDLGMLPAAPRGAQVAVEVRGPATAAAGEPLHYEIIVRNTGATPAAQVHIDDALPPGARLLKADAPAVVKGDALSWDLGALEAGAERRLKLDLQCAGTQELLQTPRVAYTAGVGLRTRVVGPAVAPQTNGGGLTLRLDAPRQTATGREIDCRLEAVNPANAPANAVRLTLNVPDGLEFVSASTGGAFDPASRRIVWAVGALAGGQTQVVTFKLRGRASGDWSCLAAAEAEHLAGVRAAEAVRVESGPVLQIQMLASDDPMPLGGETMYVVRIVNQGEAPATNVRVHVRLPDGLTPLEADGPTGIHIDQQQATSDAVASLAPRQRLEFRLRVRGRSAGTWRLAADVSADQWPQPLRDQVGVHVVEDRRAAAFAPGR